MEVDRFDANRFSELYALSRKAAPRILHIVTRMKLESPQCQDSITSPVSEDASSYAESPLPYPEGPEADGQIYDALRHVAKLDMTLEETQTKALVVPPYPDDEYAQHPPIPDPWPRTFYMPMEGAHPTVQRLGTTASSAASASWSHLNSGRNLSPNSGPIKISFPAIPPRSPARRSNIYSSNSQLGPAQDFTASSARYGGKESVPGIPPSLTARASSIGSSTVVSSQSSISNQHRVRDSHADTVSPVSVVDRDSVTSERSGQSLQVPPLFTCPAAGYSRFPVDSHLKVPENSRQDVPDGLIPVDDESTEHAPPVRPPPPIPDDCSIKLSSSFYHFKGFCQGSMEILQGGIGVRRIKKQVSPMPTHDAARTRSH